MHSYRNRDYNINGITIFTMRIKFLSQSTFPVIFIEVNVEVHKIPRTD